MTRRKAEILFLPITKALGLVIALASTANAQDFGWLHYCGVNPAADCDSLCGFSAFYLADRGHWGVDYGGHAIRTISRTPNFHLFVYNSLTDNNKPPHANPGTITDEDFQWEAFLTARGRHDLYESSFMHWAEDTTVLYESPFSNCFAVKYLAGSRVRAYGARCATCTGPTCPNGTIIGTYVLKTCDGSPGPCCPVGSCNTQDPNARPIYDGATLTGLVEDRFYINFADSLAPNGTRVVGEHARWRQLYKEFLCQWNMQGQIGKLTGSSDQYYEGVFLDNSAYALYNIGNPLSGGKIRECQYVPAIPVISNDFTPFYSWYRGTFSASDATQNNGMLGLIQALQDTFALGALWHPGAKPMYVVPNVAISENRTYPTGIIKYCEFEGSILGVPKTGVDYPQFLWDGSSTSRVWLAPSESGGCSACTNVRFPTIRRTFGAYALYLMTYNGDDIWGMQFNTNQCARGSPSFPVFQSEKRWKEKNLGYGFLESTITPNSDGFLGIPTAAPVVDRDTLWTSLGGSVHVKIWKRSFENGLVYTRNHATPGEASQDSITNKWSFVLPNPPTGNFWHWMKYDGRLDGVQYNGGARFWIPAAKAMIFVSRPQSGTKCKPSCQQVSEPVVGSRGPLKQTPEPPEPSPSFASPTSQTDTLYHAVATGGVAAAGSEFWATISMTGPYLLNSFLIQAFYDSTMVTPLYWENIGVPSDSGFCSPPWVASFTKAQSLCDGNKRFDMAWNCVQTGAPVLDLTDGAQLGRIRFRALASGTTNIRWSCVSAVGSDGVWDAPYPPGVRSFVRSTVHGFWKQTTEPVVISGSFDPAIAWPLNPENSEFGTELGLGSGPSGSEVKVPFSAWGDSIKQIKPIVAFSPTLTFTGVSEIKDGWAVTVLDSGMTTTCSGDKFVELMVFAADESEPATGELVKIGFRGSSGSVYLACPNCTSNTEISTIELADVPGRVYVPTRLSNCWAGFERWKYRKDGFADVVPDVSIGRP